MAHWSRTYTVQSLAKSADIIHLKIRRRDGKEVVAKWDLLQRITNELCGADAYAIEVFPPEDQLVDETNLRHLWVIRADWLPRLL